MNAPDTIPWNQFDEEVRLVRYLIEPPPWKRSGREDEDRGLRAVYRRWSASGGDLTAPAVADRTGPSPEMVAPLWLRNPRQPEGWSDTDLQRAVDHAAMVLHLIALGADGGAPATSLGAACHRAGVSDKRFIRLMHTPRSARLEALARLFRRLRAANVPVRFASSEQDRRSSRRTLRNLQHDDLAAFLAFLFTDESEDAIARWAAAYYRTAAETDGESPAEATPATPVTQT